MRILPGICSLMIACLAQAAPPLTLHTAIEADSELKWHLQGQQGLCPAILRALAARDGALQIVWSPRPMPQRRLTVEVQQGHLDLACALGRTPEREQQFIIVEPALYTDRLVAAVRAGDSLRLSGLRDLQKLKPTDTILLNAGARLAQRLRELGITQIDDGGKRPVDNLKKLELGRGRVFLYHEPGMQQAINDAGLGAAVHVLPDTLSEDPHYLLLSRHLNAATVARVRAAVQSLQDDGSLRKLSAPSR